MKTFINMRVVAQNSATRKLHEKENGGMAVFEKMAVFPLRRLFHCVTIGEQFAPRTTYKKFSENTCPACRNF